MRKLVFLILPLSIAALSSVAHARDTKHLYSIDDAMNTEAAREKLSAGVEFYFAGQSHPGIERSFGEDFTNKKTNAFNKSDQEACQWVFLSAMLQLQERAKQLGANAVVDIRSFYKKREYASSSEYECHAGNIIAGVALKGKFVRLAR